LPFTSRRRPERPRVAPGPPLPDDALRNGNELDAIVSLQAEWSSHVLGRLRFMSQTLGLPFVRLLRPAAQTRESSREARAGASDAGALYAYDPSELLERACALEHANHSWRQSGIRPVGLIALELRTPSLEQLRAQMPELSSAAERQLGADDELRAWFGDERLRIGQRLLAASRLADLRAYARTGVPVSLRPRVWAALLDVGATTRSVARDDAEYARLVGEIARVGLLTDEGVRADVRLALDDDAFFVFAELLEEVMLVLCRDTWLCARARFATVPRLRAQPGAPREARAPVAAEPGGGCVFPPSGAIPFRGFASFACPLCYLSSEPRQVHLLNRAMWARYWCGLHALSSERGSLLPLLTTFERLLAEVEPRLVHHLALLGAQPVDLAFDWLVFAFVGYLEIDQVLLLWDRVLGYDSLDVLAVAAVAILRFRRDALLAATSEQDVADALDEAASLKIVPLMQDLLARAA
jgi:hypothetical protein